MMPTDWLYGLAGGLLIGLAASAFLLLNGRVMGASGLLGGLVDRSGWPDWRENAAFILGIILLPALVVPGLIETQTNLTGNALVIIAGGVLVGLGTRLANGCTSGHGVCGISRLSLRGIVATMFYILAGAITLGLLRHVWGLI
jgi:uncharacterized membrane protein YedE/YeeE